VPSRKRALSVLRDAVQVILEQHHRVVEAPPAGCAQRAMPTTDAGSSGAMVSAACMAASASSMRPSPSRSRPEVPLRRRVLRIGANPRAFVVLARLLRLAELVLDQRE
jgi:hypothetical protein